MNGELKCHNSESIIIKIATIVPRSYICEYVSISPFLGITVCHEKHTVTCSTAARTISECGGVFFSETQTSLKKSQGHFYDPCSWAFMGRSTNGGRN